MGSCYNYLPQVSQSLDKPLGSVTVELYYYYYYCQGRHCFTKLVVSQMYTPRCFGVIDS